MITEPLPDIPRIVTALSEWGACVVYITILARKQSWRRVAVIASLGLVAVVAFQWFAGQLPVALWAPAMLVAMGIMYVLLQLSLRTSVLPTLFLTARAVLLAEFVASFHWQLHSFFFETPHPVSAAALFVVVCGASLCAAGFAESKHFIRGAPLEVSVKEMLSSAAITAATFTLSNISFFAPNTPFSGRLGLEIFYIRTLVDLCGFVALYAQQQQRVRLQATAANTAMNSLLHSQHQQYLQSKRSIDQVNRRYHDMKNQIDVIRSESDPQTKADYIDALEESIKGFATHHQTGNSVLDIILTGKGAYCAEQGIQLSCVADGSLIDFIDVIDITSLFGNALDNAIESSMRVADKDSRLIRVAVFAQNDLLMVRVENTFDGQLRVVDGLPRTVKADHWRHGYGLRNIRGTAEKYGGTMTFNTANNWFSLRILIPMKATHQDS